ncbi:hypothetical protein [Estrella lausannensis]|uniref:Uncharacterized protein n=1 Tax=Estrella lausannensis TaxID=483423 RepID=A0A0H5E3X2_9BACT|nr:hypothetical protein [Estrella lausannensis]CRX37915.1 hypothetical protein ELAC_0560 [Estrella lausannensis]
MTPFSTYLPSPSAKHMRIACEDVAASCCRFLDLKSLVAMRQLSPTLRRFVNRLLIEKINNEEIGLYDLRIRKFEDLTNYFGSVYSKIRHLNFRGHEKVVNFTFLDSFKTLVSLDISWHSNAKKITLRRSHPHLTTITSIACCKLNSLHFLKYCPNITHLDISGCNNVTNLRSLRYSEKLISIKLLGCSAIKDFSPLSLCKDLIELDLSGCRQIGNFKFLTSCLKLRAIHIETFLVSPELLALAQQMKLVINPPEPGDEK